MSREIKTDDDFKKWLADAQGRMALDTQILYLDAYKDILEARLKSAFFSGAASVACKDFPLNANTQ